MGMVAAGEAGGGTQAFAVLDGAHLARYTLGDRALEDEILGLFVTETERLVSELADASDGATWKAAAHGIKGSARGVGAFAIGQVAAHCEAGGRPDDGERRAALIGALQGELARVREAIAAR